MKKYYIILFFSFIMLTNVKAEDCGCTSPDPANFANCILVNNDGDFIDGTTDCNNQRTLRWAIDHANGLTGGTYIKFDVPMHIYFTSEFPVVKRKVYIDGGSVINTQNPTVKITTYVGSFDNQNWNYHAGISLGYHTGVSNNTSGSVIDNIMFIDGSTHVEIGWENNEATVMNCIFIQGQNSNGELLQIDHTDATINNGETIIENNLFGIDREGVIYDQYPLVVAVDVVVSPNTVVRNNTFYSISQDAIRIHDSSFKNVHISQNLFMSYSGAGPHYNINKLYTSNTKPVITSSNDISISGTTYANGNVIELFLSDEGAIAATLYLGSTIADVDLGGGLYGWTLNVVDFDAGVPQGVIDNLLGVKMVATTTGIGNVHETTSEFSDAHIFNCGSLQENFQVASNNGTIDILEELTATLNTQPTVSYALDWGDGNVDNFTTGGVHTHTYDNDGSFTITLTSTSNFCEHISTEGIIVQCFSIVPNFQVHSYLGEVRIYNELEATLDIQPNVDYTLNWGDGSTPIDFTSGTSKTHVYDTENDYVIQLEASISNTCHNVFNENIKVYKPICDITIPLGGTPGTFKLDKHTGRIIYEQANCPVNIDFNCVRGPRDPLVKANVVAASAVTFEDHWDYESARYTDGQNELAGANTYEKGVNGKWRARSTYIFKGDLDYGVDGNAAVSEAGTFSLEYFNWDSPNDNQPNKWLRMSLVESYSPHGDALQEVNVLDIPSSAKFGFEHSVPYLVAQNAVNDAVYFESFESEDIIEDAHRFPHTFTSSDLSSEAHSGSQSLSLSTSLDLPVINASDFNQGALISFWAKPTSGSAGTITIEELQGTSGSYDINPKSTINGWSLYEVVVTNLGSSVAQFRIVNSSTLLVDDLRIQPADAQMTCYVYDPVTLRLLTVFDDQHYGLYYQYNAKGQLVRKMVETERGIKTIQETQYNLNKEDISGM